MWKSIRSLVPVLITLGLVFLFFLVLPAVGDGEVDRVQLLARAQFALKAAAQVAGLVVAFAALLVLTRRVVTGEPAVDQLAAAMCVLGGVLLFEPHWAVAVTFGLLAMAPVIERLVTGHRSSQTSDGLTAAGGVAPDAEPVAAPAPAAR